MSKPSAFNHCEEDVTQVPTDASSIQTQHYNRRSSDILVTHTRAVTQSSERALASQTSVRTEVICFSEDDLLKATADASGPPSRRRVSSQAKEEGALSPSRNQQQRARPYVICQNVLVPVNWGFEDSVHLSEYRHPDT